MSYLWYIACEIWPAYLGQTTAYKLGKRNKKVFSITNHLHVFHFNRALRFYGWIAEVIYRKIIAFALNISSKSNDENICLMIRHKPFEFLGCSLSMIRKANRKSIRFIYYLLNVKKPLIRFCARLWKWYSRCIMNASSIMFQRYKFDTITY